MRQDGDLDNKGVVNELRIPEVLGVVLLCLVIVVPFLLVAHARDERLRREREAVRRQCEAVRAKGGQCDWSKVRLEQGEGRHASLSRTAT